MNSSYSSSYSSNSSDNNSSQSNSSNANDGSSSSSIISEHKLFDLYEYLGIANDATDDEIKRAYKRLAKLYHPDKPTGSREKFQELKAVYEIMSDPQKKRTYDYFKKNGVKMPSMGNLSEDESKFLLSHFFVGATIGTLYCLVAVTVSFIFSVPMTTTFFPSLPIFLGPTIAHPEQKSFAFAMGGFCGMIALPFYAAGFGFNVGKKLLEAPYKYIMGDKQETDKSVLVLDESEFEFISKAKAEYDKVDEIERNWTFLSSEKSNNNSHTELFERVIANIVEMFGVIEKHFNDMYPSNDSELILKKMVETKVYYEEIDKIISRITNNVDSNPNSTERIYPVLEENSKIKFKKVKDSLMKTLEDLKVYVANVEKGLSDPKQQIPLLSLAKNIEIFLEEFIFNSFEYYQI